MKQLQLSESFSEVFGCPSDVHTSISSSYDCSNVWRINIHICLDSHGIAFRPFHFTDTFSLTDADNNRKRQSMLDVEQCVLASSWSSYSTQIKCRTILTRYQARIRICKSLGLFWTFYASFIVTHDSFNIEQSFFNANYPF